VIMDCSLVVRHLIALRGVVQLETYRQDQDEKNRNG